MMNSNSKLCRYLHIPIQSGSNMMLKAMARKYSVSEFRQFIDWVYETVPDICIGTDVIVGFPGETKSYFDETVANLMTMPIHYMHVFSYSDRKFARSTRRDGRVSPEDIAKRSKVLRELSQQKKQTFYNRFQGKQVAVLFESKKKGLWSGLTDNYIRVFYQSDDDLKNKFVSILYQG